jgi:hypothetical protein
MIVLFSRSVGSAAERASSRWHVIRSGIESVGRRRAKLDCAIPQRWTECHRTPWSIRVGFAIKPSLYRAKWCMAQRTEPARFHTCFLFCLWNEGSNSRGDELHLWAPSFFFSLGLNCWISSNSWRGD